MMPEDDPTWPECNEHPGNRHWCEQTAYLFKQNLDAQHIQPGLRYCVPIIPVKDAYAEVVIAIEVINNLFSNMFLIKNEGAVFSGAGQEIPIGFYTKGEGRLSMASVIADWADGIVPDKCSSPTHGYKEERSVVALLQSGDDLTKKLYWWDLAYHDMCSFCWMRRINAGMTLMPSAETMGIDPNDFSGTTTQTGPVGITVTGPVTSQNMTNTTKQQQTMEALRNRLKL
jgi:hypothetical protein